MDTLTELLIGVGTADLADAWRRSRADRQDGPVVLVAGHDARRVARVADEIPGTTRTLVVPTTPAELGPEIPEALLGADGLVWVTPVTGPLGSAERAVLDALVGAPLPRDRRIVLGDAHLLHHLSDDPAAEAEAIRARAAGLLPEGWRLAEPTTPWPHDLTDRRHEGVAAWLRQVADTRLRRRAAEVDDRIASLRTAIEGDQAHDEAARSAAARLARRWLAVARREGDELLGDLRAFLADLADALPAQVGACEDRAAARRALPHWLRTIVETWLADRLARANAAIHDALADGDATDEELRRAALLLPAVQPDPVPRARDGVSRLAATAALGGGAAMVWMGLPVVGVLTLAGGLAWTGVIARSDATPPVDGIVRPAQEALRRLGREVEAVLAEQRQRITSAADALMAARLQTLEDAQAGARAARHAQLAGAQAERAALEDRRAQLTAS